MESKIPKLKRAIVNFIQLQIYPFKLEVREIIAREQATFGVRLLVTTCSLVFLFLLSFALVFLLHEFGIKLWISFAGISLLWLAAGLFISLFKKRLSLRLAIKIFDKSPLKFSSEQEDELSKMRKEAIQKFRKDKKNEIGHELFQVLLNTFKDKKAGNNGQATGKISQIIIQGVSRLIHNVFKAEEADKKT